MEKVKFNPSARISEFAGNMALRFAVRLGKIADMLDKRYEKKISEAHLGGLMIKGGPSWAFCARTNRPVSNQEWEIANRALDVFPSDVNHESPTG